MAKTGGNPNPLDRPATWSMGASVSSGPLTRASKTKGGSKEIIQNSAGEPIKGLTSQRIGAQLTLSGVSEYFPTNYLLMVGKVNSDQWGASNPHAWLCTGLTVNEKIETVDMVSVTYYEYSVTFTYNDDVWQIEVPDVGTYYIEDGQKKQPYVEDRQGNYVNATGPVALDGNGGLDTSGTVSFRTYFPYNQTSFSGLPTPPNQDGGGEN